jgi:hypothetical protein
MRNIQFPVSKEEESMEDIAERVKKIRYNIVKM